MEKCFSQSGSKVQERKKSGRVKAAAVSEAGADHVIFVRRECLQNIEQIDRSIEETECPIHQLDCASVVAGADRFPRTIKHVRRPLQNQLRCLMHDLEHQLVGM